MLYTVFTETHLREIVDKDVEGITTQILFEELPYETAVTALQKVMDSEIFARD